MSYYPEGSYEKEMYDFSERMRLMLCAGYGEGHELHQFADILWARNEVFVRLTPAEITDIMGREAPLFHRVATGQMTIEDARKEEKA